MVIQTKTAKSMIRILNECCGDNSEKLLEGWNNVSGLNNNFKNVLKDLISFLTKDNK